jgi:prepilin-type N-terminal cleavage/methylation domain-containing protein
MRKGFTLLELLIVIGILAILSAATVLVINPAELMRQSRDSQRLNDLAALNSAIAFYISNTSSPDIGSNTVNYATVDGVQCLIPAGALSSNHAQKNDGTGWVPIKFSSLTGGSPIGNLPIDPSNVSSTTASYYYVYLVANSTNLTYKLMANMESTRYKNGGSDDKESKDGGSISTIYEIGTGINDVATSASSSCFAVP